MAKRKRIIILGIILGLVTLLGITQANSVKEEQILLLAESEKVDISLSLSTSRKEPLLPDINLPINAQITNEGIPCYVRFKLTIDGNNENELIKALSNDWVIKDDGYIYCNHILKEDEIISLFDNIYLKQDIFIDNQDLLDLKVFADAIQAKHFTSNLNSNNPWGEVFIEEAIEKSLGGDSI